MSRGGNRPRLLCRSGLLFLLPWACLAGAAEPPAEPPARRIALAILSALGENARRPERPPGPAQTTGPRRLSGDPLADHLIRTACGAARARIDTGTPPAETARGLLIALGVALDPSGLLRRHPIARALTGSTLTPEEAAGSQEALRKATLRGRLDALQHFAVAAALVALGGEPLALAAGLEKEALDAQGKDLGSGSGFSFADLTADMAGIEFAKKVLGQTSADLPVLLDRLAAEFRGADFVPGLDRWKDDPSECQGWKEFAGRFGS